MICNLCPKKCNAERTDFENNGGYCKAPSLAVVSRAGLHFWEEPCISGTNGSGTVFFSGCSLSCVYCQNGEISHQIKGKTVSVERLAEIFKELYEKGAENINLVNPTHYVTEIEKAFNIYKPPIPIVYNSSGYESQATLNAASRFVDVFLMDLKYLDADKALRYSNAYDYPQVAKLAIMRCAEIVKQNVFDERGMCKKGLIIRHLILPRSTNEAICVIKWVEENVPWAVLSIMSQYTPCGDLENFSEINRKITLREHNKVLFAAENSKIEKIYTQELSSVGEEYIPDFDCRDV